jgi:hypothetical protein
MNAFNKRHNAPRAKPQAASNSRRGTAVRCVGCSADPFGKLLSRFALTLRGLRSIRLQDLDPIPTPPIELVRCTPNARVRAHPAILSAAPARANCLMRGACSLALRIHFAVAEES